MGGSGAGGDGLVAGGAGGAGGGGGSMEADLARAVPAVPAVLPDGLWTTRGDPRVFDRDLVTCPPSGHRICPPTKGRPSGAAHHACPSPGDYGYGLSVFVPWASQ